MSNAIVVPDTFKGPVAAAFQGQLASDDLSGGITGGYGLLKYRGKVWSIQHNGATQNLMREDGDGPRGSVDLVIVKANAALSKTWYENGWDENNSNPPDCASANGIFPDAGVPKKQADVCALCPKNAWNSAPNGGKGKACGDHRRLAVVPKDDLRNEFFGGPLLLRCPAASLTDMAAFDARYKSMGYPYFTMAIKIGFDPQESYPKFTFAAIRPLTEAEAQIVIELRNSPLTARVVNEGAAPGVAQVAAPQQQAFLEAPPPNAVAPQVMVQPGPVAQPAPAAAAQPGPATVGPVVPPGGGNGAVAGVAGQGGGFGPVAAVQPAVARPGPVAQPATQPVATVSTGFGPVAAAPAQPAPVAQPVQQVAQPVAAQPAPVKAPVQMTGFGAVTPEVIAPAPAQAAPQGPTPQPQAAPGVVSAFEGSIDDRLQALLGN
jgi:hypothetical protein